jgi:hypothetical protein
MSSALKLCWWEVDELLEHLRSRPDLWTQSSDNEQLWLREDHETEAFGLLLIAPPDMSSPFRMFALHPIEMAWDSDYVDSYLLWLVSHWTSFRRRSVVTAFLERELGVPTENAPLAAIAIEGLSWEEDATPEPSAPPVQEELWPAPVPPPTSFAVDPTLVGTFLLSGNSGWLQLRLLGGMLRVNLVLRTRNTQQTIPLQGLVRPLNGRTRDAAAKIAGWAEPFVALDEVSDVPAELFEDVPSIVLKDHRSGKEIE